MQYPSVRSSWIFFSNNMKNSVYLQQHQMTTSSESVIVVYIIIHLLFLGRVNDIFHRFAPSKTRSAAEKKVFNQTVLFSACLILLINLRIREVLSWDFK